MEEERKFSKVGLYIHTTPGWELKKVKGAFDDYLEEVNKMPPKYRALLTDGMVMLSQASIYDDSSDSSKEEVNDFIVEALAEIAAE